MKIWKLSPVGQKRARHEYVRIRAENEERARKIASTAFERSKAQKTIHSIAWSELNWLDKYSVDCIWEDEDSSNIEGILDIV